jgi:RNA polymerase sigma factor (sigma-70 family)
MRSSWDTDLAPEVLLRARAGDAAAHELIYSVLSKPVYTVIRRLVVRPAIADELLQDVFVEVLRSIGNYRSTGPFPAWVRSIAVSKALMYLRSPWHRQERAFDSEPPEHQTLAAHGADSDVSSAELDRALSHLPAISRSIVWLHDVEGYTHAELARLYGRSVSFSKSQLARAHAQLREALEPQAGALACTPTSKTC